MSHLTQRLGLAVFTVLTGALATNMFLLQPPARRGLTGPEDRMASARPSTASPPASAPSRPAPVTAPSTPALPVTPAVATAPVTAEPAAATPAAASPSASTAPPVTPSEAAPLKVAPPPSVVQASPDLIKAIQRELRLKGYETGAEDGSLSLVTRAAIMAYEADQALPLTAEPKDELLQHMILGDPGGAAPKAAPSVDLPASAADVVREVQRELKRTGHDPGAEDARLSEATIRAIGSFEAAEKLPPKGRISGELLAKLKSAPAKQASR